MSTGVNKKTHITLAAFLLLLTGFCAVATKAGSAAGSAMLHSAESNGQRSEGLPSCEPFEEHFEKIDALLKEGRWTDAEVAVIQIGKIAPKCPMVQLFSGKIHYYRRNDRKALALFNDLATRHPELHLTYHFRGLIYHEQGLHTVALEEFHKVMMTSPTVGSGYFIRYILPCLESDGRLDPTRIDTMLHFVTHTAARSLSRGYLAFFQDDYSTALGHFKNVTEAAPGHAGAWLYAGLCHEYMHWRLEALYCYNKAIDADETFSRAWLHRGLIKINEGNWYRGCRDLHQAKELEDPAANMAINNFCRRGQFQ